MRTSALARLGGLAGVECVTERSRDYSSYRVQAAAVISLGEIGGDPASAVLEETAARASPRDIVARATREAFAGVNRTKLTAARGKWLRLPASKCRSEKCDID